MNISGISFLFLMSGDDMGRDRVYNNRLSLIHNANQTLNQTANDGIGTLGMNVLVLHAEVT